SPAQRDMAVVDAIGWIIPLLDVIEQKLSGFDPDSADVDARLEHRIQLATFLSAVAHHFRFERLRRQLLPVLEARHIGFSYLVLKSDWIEEEETLPISTLGVDVPGRVAVWAAQGDETVSVDLPITGRTLAGFFQLTYLE